ncbi:ATP12-domain-containing protein, partial [Pleomassaria siparia CBS 279.74]
PRRARCSLYQCLYLHTSSIRHAVPLPSPLIPGPPPDAPTPQSEAIDRVNRKRKQAELLRQAREVRSSPSTKPNSILRKRFWKDVTVKEAQDGLQIWLDTRPVRTPAKQILTIPHSKHQLATAIALEWDLLHSAQQALKTHYIPMTSLAARAIDIEQADADGNTHLRQDMTRMMMRYLSTDTLLCWAPEKHRYDAPQDTRSLRQLQIQVATPIMAYLRTHVWPGVDIRPVLEPDSIMPIPQPELTQEVVRGWLSGLPAFELAGLERAMLASKSLLVGARLVHEWGEAFAQSREAADAGRFGIEEAAEASSLEVRWQTSQCGEVEDTHDVEREDLKRQLGSVVLLVGG